MDAGLTGEQVCVDCGITFDPLPWADPDDFVCDECIERDDSLYHY